MSWTASPDSHLAGKVLVQPSGDSASILIEKIAIAIAEAQVAVFTGRIEDLGTSITHQQELCAALETLQGNKFFFRKSNSVELVTTAQRVRRQNLLFGAVLRRMHGHLSTLRNLLNGLSLTYQPEPLKAPGRES
jgi:hypothetical protein